MKSYRDGTGEPVPPVLLVDDNRINQMVAVQLLKRCETAADVASSAEEALARLSERHYRLVLMDVQMPGMDGIEATRIIRDPDSSVVNHDVPIIAMTAYNSPEDRSACLDAGMNDYLTKPLAVDRFREVVEHYLTGNGKDEVTQEQRAAKGAANGAGAEVVRTQEAPAAKGAAERPVVGEPDNSDALPVIDRAELLARSGGDATLARDFLERFLDRIRTETRAIAEAIGSHDRDSVIRQIHTLYGTSGNLGARRLHAVLRTMHTHARDGEIESVRRLLPHLQAEIDAVLSEGVTDEW